MNIGFIMYEWEKVDPVIDSTLRLIHGAVLRGHNVSVINPGNLTIREGIPCAFCKVIKKEDKVSKNNNSFYKNAKFKQQMLPLSGFDAIFLRDDPPVNNTVLNFMDSVKDDVFIVNDIDGMRKASNKLYPASYYDPNNPFVPKTHVSKNKEYLLSVIDESEDDKMILKPLDGFGGSGVIVIEKSARHNMKSLLDFYISGRDGKDPQYVILQQYVPGAELGDVRVLMLNGEPIGAMRRVPADGENRSNISAGGTAVKHNLSKEEKAICKAIGPQLVADGLFFVGIDLIGTHLIEINVSSPGGIPEINQMSSSKVKIQDKVMEYVESVVGKKAKAEDRRRASRQAVQDA
jgi:glutathione synthase